MGTWYRKGWLRPHGLLPLLLLLLVLCCSVPSSISFASAFRAVEIGKKVPDIRLKDVDGAEFKLSSLKGKRVVILFWWAETEAKEKRSLLILNRLEELCVKHRAEGLEFVSVISDPNVNDKVKALKRQHSWTHHVLVDEKREVYGAYGVYIVPAVGILDQEHRLLKALPYTHTFVGDMEGELLVAMGKKTQAEWEKARRPQVSPGEEDKNKARTHVNLGKDLLRKGADEQAKENFARAIQLDSGCGEAYVGLGMVLLREKKSREALDHFQKGIEIDPRSTRGHIGMALALELLGENRKAIEALEALPGSHDDDAEIHYHLGRIYEKQGQKDRALSEYKKALQSALEVE